MVVAVGEAGNAHARLARETLPRTRPSSIEKWGLVLVEEGGEGAGEGEHIQMRCRYCFSVVALVFFHREATIRPCQHRCVLFAYNTVVLSGVGLSSSLQCVSGLCLCLHCLLSNPKQ